MLSSMDIIPLCAGYFGLCFSIYFLILRLRGHKLLDIEIKAMFISFFLMITGIFWVGHRLYTEGSMALLVIYGLVVILLLLVGAHAAFRLKRSDTFNHGGSVN